MKLAEALISRADLQKRIAQLDQRLRRNAQIQEGERPAEDPGALLTELESLTEQWERLIQRINRTNSYTELTGGGTLSDALAVRDVLKRKQEIYRNLAASATVVQDRVSRSEIKFRSAVDVVETQRTADRLAQQLRELDTRIQSANWQTDLLE